MRSKVHMQHVHTHMYMYCVPALNGIRVWHPHSCKLLIYMYVRPHAYTCRNTYQHYPCSQEWCMVRCMPTKRPIDRTLMLSLPPSVLMEIFQGQQNQLQEVNQGNTHVQ